jgi:filamentous hemagglutinin family protein
MKQIARSLFLFGSLALCPLLDNQPAEAQIAPDGTLSTTVTTPDGSNFTIEDGDRRGGNLFHSFSEFSVPTGGSASFNNAPDVQNIINRVTGGSVSNIDGLLRANCCANVFLLNPAGIIFGPNASLNIGGSFYGSTADSLVFPEGEFSATDTQSPPLLTINAPIGLNFRDNPQNITVNESILEVNAGETFALIGGNVSIEGGESGFIEAPGGRVELGGLSAAGTVGLNSDGSLSFPDDLARADVSLTNIAFVGVAGDEGGNIGIHARTLEILGESKVQGGTFASGLAGGQSGDIILDATGAIQIDSSTIDNSVEIGNAGKIEINATSFSLTNDGEITNSTFGKGNAGNITISANNNVQLSNADIFSNVGAGAEGKGGQIKIDTSNLYLNASAQIQTIVRQADKENNLAGGVGDAGNIIVNALGDVAIDGVSNDDNQFPSGLRSTVGSGAIGNGGNIEINARSFSITNGAALSSSTLGEGKAGNVTVNASDRISLDAGDIFSNVGAGAKGTGGQIKIDTGNLDLKAGSQITTSVIEADRENSISGGVGDAGNIIVNARGNVAIDGVSNDDNQFPSGLRSTVGSGAIGNGGNIEINARSFSITNGAALSSSTLGEGKAGNIIVNARGNVAIDGVSNDDNQFPSGLRSTVRGEAEGNAGEITISADSISLTNGAQIQSGVFEGGLGDGNNVTLNARGGNVTISGSDQGKSGIFTDVETNSTYNAGNIKIDAQGSIILNDALLNSKNAGTGFAGDINLNAPDEISIKDSLILAEGNFGRIFIGDAITPSQVKLEGTRTENNSEFSFSNRLSTTNSNADDLAGSITINARDSIDVIGSEIESRTQTTRTTDINDQDGLNFSTINLKVAEDNSTGTITINQSRISTTNIDVGFAGDVRLNARGKVEILDTSIFSRGNLGRILIGKSDLSGETSSPQEVNFNNSFLTVSNKSVENAPETQIDAGEISIDAVNNISFVNDSEISTVTERLGDAGNLTIQSENGSVFFDNSNVFSNVEPGGIGNAGDINITANSIFLINGTELQSGIVKTKNDSTPSGRGNGGNIRLNAEKNITLSGSSNQDTEDGSGIFTDVEETAIGNGGNIELTTGSLFLTDKAILTTESSGFGNAGNIKISADSITFDRDSSISASNTPSVDISNTLSGGNINLQISDNLILRNNSLISAAANNNADGGNIDIDARFIIAYPSQVPNDGNDIIASAERGRGGNININTQQIFGLQERRATPGNGTNDIDASSEFGISGEVVITNLVDDINQGVVESPDNVVEPETVTAQACPAAGRVARGESSFTITGRGGLPALATDPLNSDQISIGGDDAAQNSQKSSGGIVTVVEQPNPPSSEDIVPARGMIVNEKGEIVLTAYPTPNTSQRTPTSSVRCTGS